MPGEQGTALILPPISLPIHPSLLGCLPSPCFLSTQPSLPVTLQAFSLL